MKRITAVQPREGFRVWIRFADGVEGEVDLGHLADQGVFRLWRDRKTFERVQVGEFGELSWGEGVDLCPDALYLRLTGQSVAEVFEAHAATTHA